MARSALAAVMVAGSLVAASAADTIVVEGNSRVDADTIRSYFNGSDANEAVKKLYETGFFSDVKVSRSGSSVVVHVVENTKSINHVVFVGNSKVKSEDLEKEVRSRNHGAYSQIIVDSDVQRNMQLLKERPWFDIPIVYTNGGRAILAIEKGAPGDRAFADAFAAWSK